MTSATVVERPAQGAAVAPRRPALSGAQSAALALLVSVAVTIVVGMLVVVPTALSADVGTAYDRMGATGGALAPFAWTAAWLLLAVAPVVAAALWATAPRRPWHRGALPRWGAFVASVAGGACTIIVTSYAPQWSMSSVIGRATGLDAGGNEVIGGLLHALVPGLAIVAAVAVIATWLATSVAPRGARHSSPRD